MDSRISQIHEGMEVFDRDGDKIGMAGETLGHVFNVDAGFLGMKEYYVPFEAVTDVRDDAIYVNCVKDDIDRMGWDHLPAGRTETAERDTLRLREEELRATRTPVETGRVQLAKEVVEESRTLEVPVTREEVYVERHPIERRPSDRPIEGTETEEISVPVREEHVEVEKRPVVYEEVGIGKRATQETRQVSDTVRREELRMEKEGDVELRNDPGGKSA
jgi:uncharacterized protein (TIGR02271 family)